MIALEVGRRIGLYRKRTDPEGASKGFGAVEGAIFGLMGLLIAFTFSGAGERFEHRRSLITQETNAIGTAWLRIDLLPPDDQPAMRQMFRDYLDARLAIYHDFSVGDLEGERAANDRAIAMQWKIWSEAIVSADARHQNPAATLFLPALNDMFDITTTRAVATETHPPTIVFAMLVALALLCATLAGYDLAESRTRNWLHIVGFAAIMTITLYVIIDLEKSAHRIHSHRQRPTTS